MAKKKAEAEVFADASEYQDADRLQPGYVFPFTLLDPTPGGANLGRIEWHVELIPARKRSGEKNRKRIAEVRVWATQTRDPRYQGKQFRFETIAEALSHRSRDGRGFQPWRVMFCDKHRGAVVLTAYPENHHTRLIVEPSSSISCEVHFA